jgi:UDP-N-acetyl-D-glucosamine dehydrogenase
VELSGQINEQMPEWVVERVMDMLNDHGKSLRGSRVLLVGVSYKKDIPDMRESPALKVLEKLHQKGARLSYHDPHVEALPWHYGGLQSRPLTPETLAETDCAVLLTDHSQLDYEMLVRCAPAVLDTRNALKGFRQENVTRL